MVDNLQVKVTENVATKVIITILGNVTERSIPNKDINSVTFEEMGIDLNDKMDDIFEANPYLSRNVDVADKMEAIYLRVPEDVEEVANDEDVSILGTFHMDVDT